MQEKYFPTNQLQSQEAKQIFIVGAPISGTTLIGNYLGSCKSVCHLGEYAGFFFSYYIAKREYLRVPTPYKEQYINELQEHAKSFANKIALEQSCSFYCDSTPGNLLIAMELADRLPNAIFILTLRHYSGVLQSLNRSYRDGFQWAGSTWIERANLWRNFYANVRFLPKSRTVSLSYDKLCANPRSTIAAFKDELANRIGLDISGINESQLAKSHATNVADRRPTIGIQSDTYSTLLPSIPSFEAKFWNETIEKEIRPITNKIDELIRQLFPDSYIAPMGYFEEIAKYEL